MWLVFSSEALATTATAGLGLSVANGQDGPRFGLELSLGVHQRFGGPTQDPDLFSWPTLGGALRIRWEGRDQFAMGAAIQAGALLAPGPSSLAPGGSLRASGEAGVAWRGGERLRALVGGDASIGSVTWFEIGCYESAYVQARSGSWGRNVHADVLLGAGRAEVLAGLGATWTPQEELVTQICVGRPLRLGPRVLQPAVACHDPPDATALRWLRAGRDELASVTTFLRLARELAHVGVPTRLQARAARAAREELGHAALCFGMAARRCGPVAAMPLPVVPRRFPDRATALAVHAAEALVDGAIGEAASASEALCRAEAARDDFEADVLERIAREEATHAALGRDLTRWCAPTPPPAPSPRRVPAPRTT